MVNNYICNNCGSDKIRFYENGDAFCGNCGNDIEVKSYHSDDSSFRTHVRLSPYERTRAAMYATGNRWAIENFNATH